MEILKITGGRPLRGSVAVSGAKNAVLPLLAATLLTGGVTTLQGCPRLRDVDAATAILRHLGCRVEGAGDTLTVDSSTLTRWDLPDSLMREMRSSVIFLGPLLARLGRAELTFPGGCQLGPRPIDLHLQALEQLGAAITLDSDRISCVAPSLRGAEIALAIPSVGATENAMLAAVGCTGVTRISNAAREPEIEDLQTFLRSCGVQITGAGTGEIVITGGLTCRDVEHRVLPDRIEAATFLCAAAACGGDVTVTGCVPEHLAPVLEQLEQGGACIRRTHDAVQLRLDRRLGPMGPVRTMPHPGFPTDAQAPLMAAACTAAGATVFEENIFEDRFRHVPQLRRMGASIRTEGRLAAVEGINCLRGADVTCTDLRGGAALVIAALAAAGESTVRHITHIDRGYQAIEEKLSALGAAITRTEV